MIIILWLYIALNRTPKKKTVTGWGQYPKFNVRGPRVGGFRPGARRPQALRSRMQYSKWGFPKIRGTILGVPIIRTIVFGGLYWVPLFWETTI